MVTSVLSRHGSNFCDLQIRDVYVKSHKVVNLCMLQVTFEESIELENLS